MMGQRKQRYNRDMVNKKSYKELQEELNTIISELQSEEIDIDEAVIKFEQATKITKQIKQYLDTAENTLKRVNK
jgi:exodeoxyribonuclease VII small subunit